MLVLNATTLSLLQIASSLCGIHSDHTFVVPYNISISFYNIEAKKYRRIIMLDARRVHA